MPGSALLAPTVFLLLCNPVASLSYCRLAEEHVTPEGQPLELAVPPASGSGPARRYLRSVQRVPVRQPFRRRPDAWFEAWWQPAVVARLDEAAASGGPGGEHAASQLQDLMAEQAEVGGWTAIRGGNHRTHDVAVRYWSAG